MNMVTMIFYNNRNLTNFFFFSVVFLKLHAQISKLRNWKNRQRKETGFPLHIEEQLLSKF
jgi:hypothetical protein